MSFSVIGGTPRSSSRLKSYGLVNLESLKNGYEAPKQSQVLVKG
jgi:hypothetical protein